MRIMLSKAHQENPVTQCTEMMDINVKPYEKYSNTDKCKTKFPIIDKKNINTAQTNATSIELYRTKTKRIISSKNFTSFCLFGSTIYSGAGH